MVSILHIGNKRLLLANSSGRWNYIRSLCLLFIIKACNVKFHWHVLSTSHDNINVIALPQKGTRSPLQRQYELIVSKMLLHKKTINLQHSWNTLRVVWQQLFRLFGFNLRSLFPRFPLWTLLVFITLFKSLG